MNDELILYKLVDVIQSYSVRETLLRKGANLALEKAMEISKTNEVSKKQERLVHHLKEFENIFKKR